MNRTPSNDIDWDVFWQKADEEKQNMAATGQYGQADRLERFFEGVCCPNTVGSFGCGPADCERTVAERYPDIEFYCYDTASSVVEQNRRESTHENVRFGVETLPGIETGRRFDVVYCFATLFYVADIETAVERLYDRVRDDGYLVFDYPNRLTPAAFRRVIEDDANDTEWFRKRFALVLNRENLLSYERIHDLLGRWPQNYASAVGDSDSVGSWAAPQVFVPN